MSSLAESSETVRILFVINNLSKGGAETLLVNFLDKLSSTGNVEPELLLLEDKGHQSNFLTLEKAGITYHTLLGTGIYNPLRAFKELRRFFKLRSYDCIHVHLFPAMYWLALCKLLRVFRCPLIFTEHSTKNRRLGKWYLKGLENFIYNQYDAIICVSEAIRSRLSGWLRSVKKMKVIYNGIELRSSSQASDIREEFKIASEDIVLLMVARFEPNKDHLTLIDAVASLKMRNLKLLLAGEGNTKTSLQTYVQSQGLQDQVFFLGVRSDVRSLMAQADINVLSTEYEGLSGVTIEAMASSKPFIGSNVPGVSEIVGDKTSLFKYSDRNDLACKIKGLLLDDMKRESNIRLNSLAVQKFDINGMVQQHMALYKSFLLNA